MVESSTMAWKRLGDIHPLYNHVTLVAGDINVMAGWPGAEAAGYPDDEYELDSGTVLVFDLNLVKPTVFMNDGCIRLLASLDGKGTANVDDATIATALDAPGSTKTWGSFEVEHGAMVLTCSDCATPVEGTSTGDPKQPNLPKNAPGEPTRLGNTMLVIPCENGRYDVSQVAKVEAKHGSFDFLLQLTIRKTASSPR